MVLQPIKKLMMKKILYTCMAILIVPAIANAQTDTLYVYGPGGPFAPINECAQLFGKKHNIVVKVTAGPEANWIGDALSNADIIFGGAEYMLTSFALKHPGMIDSSTRTELYKRGAAILVRLGNPKHIKNLADLTKKGIRILDVNGAGQFGLWEDLAGKQNLIEEIQRNIKTSFENTALGISAWKADTTYDAWITYASWHYRLKDITQLVKIPTAINVYRGTPIAITNRSAHKDLSELFINFMLSNDGHIIFKKWGWE